MMTMNFGDIGFIDTSNCYHFGSRKDTKPRKLLMIQFTSSFCIDLPIIFRKKNKYAKKKLNMNCFMVYMNRLIRNFY